MSSLPIRHSSLEILLFTLGLILPYAITWVVLWRAGALQQFIFWTISYARKYSAGAPLVIGAELLRSAFSAAVGPNFLLWVLPWIGAVLLWWERRLEGNQRFFLTALLLCSIASVCVGFYFRAHYFITLLPIMAWLSGIAVSRSARLIKQDRTIELGLAVVILILFAGGSLAAIIGNGSVWFGTRPAQASRAIYGTTLFSEAMKTGEYIRAHSSKDARVLVVGSEPEIYFYAHRRSATGYIYMYPLMEKQAYALKMQEEMIAESERAKPEYAVYVEDNFSWLVTPESQQKVLDWWNSYWPVNYDLVETIAVKEGAEEEEERSQAPGKPKYVLLFKRKG